MKAPRHSPSIRRQLTLKILAGALAMLLMAGLFFFGVIHNRIVGDFDRMLEAEAEVLAQNAERKGRVLVWEVPDTYTARSRPKGDPAYCQLFLEDGTVVGLSETLGMDNLTRFQDRKHALRNGRLPDGRNGRILQKTFIPHSDETQPQIAAEDPREQTFTLPNSVHAQNLQLVLVVARSREGLDRLLWSLGAAGLVAASGLAIGLALLVRLAITRALRPVDEMNKQIAAIAPDALATRLRVAQPPIELAAIETTVNRLLERVETAFNKERRFSSDLAHELRTPIAELRTACEVGSRWPEDVEATRQFFEDTGKIALQLEKIVSTMLSLAQCEKGLPPGQTHRILLQPLVDSIWQKAASAVEAKKLKFENHIPADLAIECDIDKLGIIVRNLVENAIAHGDPGTVARCGGGPTATGVELWLVNSAKTFERADLDHVFDRFWRKDTPRSDRNHAGLGLSITRALCRALGLTLSVDLKDGWLFEARIAFPSSAVSRKLPAPLSHS